MVGTNYITQRLGCVRSENPEAFVVHHPGRLPQPAAALIRTPALPSPSRPSAIS